MPKREQIMAEFSIETFGRRVVEERVEQGWSPAELSRRAELNQSTICKVEQGKVPNLSLRVALQIADALGASLDYLCEGE